MAINIELIACKQISDQAREALAKAQCPIHKDVPGIEELEIVELQYGDNNDRTGLFVWGVPREIEITSRGLYLAYNWDSKLDGYKLSLIGEDEQTNSREAQTSSDDDALGDLSEHPF